MKVAVIDINGKKTGRSVELSEAVFGIEPNDHAIYLDVKQYMANQRQGTHKTKDRAEISRSTRKIFRQKGTGGARHGSLKSGIFVGGARIHGPRPRDYSFKLNKKVKHLARKSALTLKANETKQWYFVANVNQTIGDIQKISKAINNDQNLLESTTLEVTHKYIEESLEEDLLLFKDGKLNKLSSNNEKTKWLDSEQIKRIDKEQGITFEQKNIR